MKTRVLDSSLVINFMNVGFSSDEVLTEIKLKADEQVKKIENESLKDWELIFRFIYNNVKQILIYTKNKSYSKEKYKEIIVHIPVPTTEIVPWGVKEDQHVYSDNNHLDSIIKNFDRLDVDFTIFTNRSDYLLACMCRSVKFCFEKGFTINGVKCKIG
jgi:hypothetical protein